MTLIKISLLSLLSVLGFALKPDLVEFNDFTETFAKNYSVQEYDLRFDIFRNNLARIRAHNADPTKSWRMGINQFTDLTPEEFRMRYLGFKKPLENNIPRLTDYSLKNVKDLPKEVDWTQNGVVNPVKNQAQCGSCWAFSTVGSIESAYAIKTKELYSLSEQQLVDCSQSYGNQGCNGGLMDDGFQYAEQNALCSEDSYPYQAQDGTCRASSCKGLVKVKSYVDIPSGDENALQSAVAKQPVSVAIEADQNSFQFYSGGVLDAECGHSLDHGVIAVGYGEDNGKPFWKVRNSWGSSWGENGYIRLIRGKGECGIADSASYPVV